MITTLFAAVLAAAAAPPPMVTAVRLEALAEDAARLSRYVEIKPGDRLDPEAVRHAVQLLYATGEFEDVQVVARPTSGGVEVVFRTVHAPLLTGLAVEGDPVLSVKRIEHLTRLRRGEPLWPARLEKVSQQVAVALTGEGYLEARVQARAERAGHGARAVFAITSGPLVRLGRIRVEGAGPATEALRTLARPGPGEPYRRGGADKAAEAMRRRLVAGGHWKAVVDRSESYDPGAARIDLAFVAQPGPRMAVAFEGPAPAGRLAGQVQALLRDGAARPDVLEEASDRLEDDLRQRGHREAAVTHALREEGDQATIVYQIKSGPRAEVASVSVDGSVPELAGFPLVTRAGAPLQDRFLEQDAQALRRALQEIGHAEAKVEVDASEGGGLVPVVFRVRAGPRTLVEAVAVTGSAVLAGPPQELRLRAGTPYRVRDLARDRSELQTAHRNAGYLQAEVTPEVVFSDDRADATVTLKVAPGPRTEVDHVVVARLEHTQERVVRRELLVRDGDPLGVQKVLESQRQLGALGLFERVAISEMDPEAGEKRSLVVAAAEAPRTTIAYGVGYAERDLFRGSVEVARRNLDGMDRSLSAFARGSFRGNRLLATYREPRLLGHALQLFVTGFREEEARDGFSFIRYGGLAQAEHNLSPRWSLISRYTFQQTQVFRVEVPLEEVDRQFRTSTFSGPSVSVVNDTRDDPLDPRRGHFLGADTALSLSPLGGDAFAKLFVQAAAYQRLTARLVAAYGVRLGLGRTFGVGQPLRLPLPDRFFAGGDYSLRGFPVDRVGPLEPSSAGNLVPSGGNALLIGSAELRFDAGRSVSLAAFTDAGNVYPLVRDLSLGDVRYTAGVGLRYRTALGPLRVDWGFKLNRRDDESPSHIHITVGHAF